MSCICFVNNLMNNLFCFYFVIDLILSFHPLAMSLRRVGTAVGNFFGVTEASQQGSINTMGWEEFTERRVEVCTCIFTSLILTIDMRVHVCEMQ